MSLDETSSNASCSTESQSKGPAATRESYRTSSQVGKSGTNGKCEASQGELSLLYDGWVSVPGTSCAQVPRSYGAVFLGGEFTVWGGIMYRKVILNSLLFINVMTPEDLPRSWVAL